MDFSPVLLNVPCMILGIPCLLFLCGSVCWNLEHWNDGNVFFTK